MDTPTSHPPQARPETAPDAPGRRGWPAFVTVAAIATWPPASLVAANADQPLTWGTLLAWWLATLVPALLVVAVVARVAPRRRDQTAAAVAVVVWLLYSMQTTTAIAERISPELDPVLWWTMLAPVVAVVAWLAAARRPFQQFTLVVAVAFLLGSLTPLATAAPAAGEEEPVGPPSATDPSFVTAPDVWFFVLDGLGSNAFLLERTGYDASPFEQDLEEHGFTIQREATSNYPLTHISVSSTMMMEYGFEGFEEPRAQVFFDRMQGDNRVIDLFRANGYTYAHAYPGLWSGSRCSGVEDLCVGDDSGIDDTVVALREMVPFGERLGRDDQYVAIADGNDPSRVTDQLIAADPPGPTFHFVHMLNPHAPLLRDADCNVRVGIELRFSAWGDGPEYADAVRCLHQQLTDAVEAIMEVSDDPVIVIQGDHGPRLGINWNVPDGVVLGEEMHFSILSAVRLPTSCPDVEVPDDLTPVNTFRIVRACLEGTEPELLPNVSYPIHAERG